MTSLAVLVEVGVEVVVVLEVSVVVLAVVYSQELKYKNVEKRGDNCTREEIIGN